ncbi:MAG: alpha/beta fold hydrolase, partial [Chloroflexi bacterium]|nr:alpha/beta fold hydrolase [Chloroflexota bacterium]
MPETLNISLRGGDFEAEVLKDGSGPPLLYLHGAVGQKGWAPFLDALAKKFTVYAPYLPGYSKSNGLEKLDDVTDLTLYQFELLDALGVSKAHVVGHCLGGMIAAEMA